MSRHSQGFNRRVDQRAWVALLLEAFRTLTKVLIECLKTPEIPERQYPKFPSWKTFRG